MTRIKDGNDLLQAWNAAGFSAAEQVEDASALLEMADPFILVWAEDIAKIKNFGEKNEALKAFFSDAVHLLDKQDRAGYKNEICNALSIGKPEFNERLKVLDKESPKADGDEETYFIEESLGGWYPDDETENSGYLIDIFFDRRLKKVRFAYAHITDVEKDQREIVEEADFVIIGSKKITPVTRHDVVDFVGSSAFKLPTCVGAEISSSDLINKRANFYEKFFYMEDKSKYKFFSAYSQFTWVNDAFNLLTFLSARGGSGSGKSDLMYLVGITSYRFAAISASSTDASYRGLARDYKATIMVDEVDEAIRKDDGSLASFIKASFSKRVSNHLQMKEVTGLSGEKIFAISRTDVYGPRLFTGYKPFKDAGIENRCMNFYLSQTDMLTLTEHDIEPGYYPPEIEGEAEEIRNMSLRWRLTVWKPQLELSQEQRKQYKLADPKVSARINSTLRPMKVLAIFQNDMKMLEDMKMIGRANYEDEMLKRSGSFEALILRALVAADIAFDVKQGLKPEASKEYAEKVKEYAEKVKFGDISTFGTVRYILFKDIAAIANEIMDAENDDEDDEKKNKIKPRTVGTISRESFRLDIHRTNKGKSVVLDRKKLGFGKLRFGLDREASYQPEEGEWKPEPVQENLEW